MASLGTMILFISCRSPPLAGQPPEERTIHWAASGSRNQRWGWMKLGWWKRGVRRGVFFPVSRICLAIRFLEDEARDCGGLQSQGSVARGNVRDGWSCTYVCMNVRTYQPVTYLYCMYVKVRRSLPYQAHRTLPFLPSGRNQRYHTVSSSPSLPFELPVLKINRDGEIRLESWLGQKGIC
jgi:hypothetical protein